MATDTPPRKHKKRGRPRVYATAAERQRAYRLRRAEAGRREPEPLRSEIIDLSACHWWVVKVG